MTKSGKIARLANRWAKRLYMKLISHKKRSHRDLHYLNQDGMVACNPRDREAAHRAEVEDIATEYIEAVTCKKCWQVIRKEKDRSRSRGASSNG